MTVYNKYAANKERWKLPTPKYVDSPKEKKLLPTPRYANPQKERKCSSNEEICLLSKKSANMLAKKKSSINRSPVISRVARAKRTKQHQFQSETNIKEELKLKEKWLLQTHKASISNSLWKTLLQKMRSQKTTKQKIQQEKALRRAKEFTMLQSKLSPKLLHGADHYVWKGETQPPYGIFHYKRSKKVWSSF